MQADSRYQAAVYLNTQRFYNSVHLQITMKRAIILFAVVLLLAMVAMEVESQITIRLPCDCAGCVCRRVLTCANWDLASFHYCDNPLMVCCKR